MQTSSKYADDTSMLKEHNPGLELRPQTTRTREYNHYAKQNRTLPGTLTGPGLCTTLPVRLPKCLCGGGKEIDQLGPL